jgi:hypothetical protein
MGARLASSIFKVISSAASAVSVNQSPMQRDTDIFPASAIRLNISSASGDSEIVVRIRSAMMEWGKKVIHVMQCESQLASRQFK